VIGYNTLEGFRLGAGFATLAGLSPHFALRGSGAYGFVDHRWKYSAEAEWAINPAKGYFGSYRVNSLKAAAGYDTYFLGADYLSPLPAREPFRVSLRHNEMILYRSMGSITYAYEPSRQTSFELSAGRERFNATRYISFSQSRRLDAWRASATVSWTPGGDFYQASYNRIDTKPYAPRLSARLRWVSGVDDSDNTSLTVIEATAFKVTPIGSGFTIAALVHAAFAAGHGVYPFLPTLPSGPYVLRRLGSFALLRPLELPAQRYADLHVRFDDGAMLTGLVPALRPLGLSVTLSADVAAGQPWGIRGAWPAAGDKLKWSRPYAEAGIGLDHILGIGRIEYMWRLSYRNNPGARRSGIAVGIDYVF